MRKYFDKTGIWDHATDKKNTTELKKIIKKYGWPTIPLVGKRASFCAWLLVQHADHDRQFQKRALKLLKKAHSVNSKDIDPMNIAFLTDRILVGGGEKQMFGTQFYFDRNRKLKLNPLKNRRGINKIRKDYNLPTLEFHLREAMEYNTKKRR